MSSPRCRTVLSLIALALPGLALGDPLPAPGTTLPVRLAAARKRKAPAKPVPVAPAATVVATPASDAVPPVDAPTAQNAQNGQSAQSAQNASDLTEPRAAVTRDPSRAPDGPPLVAVFSGGDALVEETLVLDPGPAGIVAFPNAESLDPASFVATLGGRRVETTLLPPVDSLFSLLRTCVGRPVQLLPGGPDAPALPESGTLSVASDPPLVRIDADRTIAVRADRVVCPTAAEARWRMAFDLPARGAKTPLALRYRLGGFGWQARHRLVLAEGGGTARLATDAVIAVPAGTLMPDARLRVVEGDIPRAGGGPVYMAEKADARNAMMAAPAPVAESRSLDLLVFDLPGSRELAGPATLVLPLREPADVPLEDVLVFEVYRSPLAPAPDEPLAPRRHLRVLIDGSAALPGGIVEAGVLRRDGTWLPLGEVATPRIAAGRTADLPLGEVRDVVAVYRRPTLGVVTEGPFQREAGVTIDLENRRGSAARIELRQELGGPFELLGADPQPTERDGSSLTWKLVLERSQVQTIRFRVRMEPRIPRP